MTGQVCISYPACGLCLARQREMRPEGWLPHYGGGLVVLPSETEHETEA